MVGSDFGVIDADADAAVETDADVGDRTDNKLVADALLFVYRLDEDISNRINIQAFNSNR